MMLCTSAIMHRRSTWHSMASSIYDLFHPLLLVQHAVSVYTFSRQTASRTKHDTVWNQVNGVTTTVAPLAWSQQNTKLPVSHQPPLLTLTSLSRPHSAWRCQYSRNVFSSLLIPSHLSFSPSILFQTACPAPSPTITFASIFPPLPGSGRLLSFGSGWNWSVILLGENRGRLNLADDRYTYLSAYLWGERGWSLRRVYIRMSGLVENRMMRKTLVKVLDPIWKSPVILLASFPMVSSLFEGVINEFTYSMISHPDPSCCKLVPLRPSQRSRDFEFDIGGIWSINNGFTYTVSLSDLWHLVHVLDPEGYLVWKKES
jgi:hypothetical protein